MENTIFTVEVPVSEQKRPEIKEVKTKEIKNLEDYKTFELVEDVGQETNVSRWVIIRKEKHNGQKTEFKVRFVTRGFHEKEKLQSDLPKAAK